MPWLLHKHFFLPWFFSDEGLGIIRKYMDNEEFILTNDMILLSDLGLDSYELVELVCEVEEKFNIEIPDRAISGFKTVQNVIDFIAVKQMGMWKCDFLLSEWI